MKLTWSKMPRFAGNSRVYVVKKPKSLTDWASETTPGGCIEFGFILFLRSEHSEIYSETLKGELY